MPEPKYLQLSPRQLKPNPWNTNVVSPDNELKIEQSITRFGVFKPIIVRELHDGTLEILGGEHRSKAAIRMGIPTVPVLNLGRMDDQKAKEIGLVDNGRYGEDDALQLAELLKSLGDLNELETFLPYASDELNTIFSSDSIAFEDLDLSTTEKLPELPTEPVKQTHQLMRFKVPADDAPMVQAFIEKIMKEQGYTAEDSFSNAGNALVWLIGLVEESRES